MGKGQVDHMVSVLLQKIILFKGILFRNYFFSLVSIMVKRHDKGKDGMYHIGNAKYKKLIGSRAEVMHKHAYKTSGDLKKDDLLYIGSRIKSKKASKSAKKTRNLGELQQPKGSGVFGKNSKTKKKKTQKKRRKN